jgi:hypothetical protein
MVDDPVLLRVSVVFCMQVAQARCGWCGLIILLAGGGKVAGAGADGSGNHKGDNPPPWVDSHQLRSRIFPFLLDMMGIEPLGALERTSTMVEKRVWRAPFHEIDVTDTRLEAVQGRLL